MDLVIGLVAILIFIVVLVIILIRITKYAIKTTKQTAANIKDSLSTKEKRTNTLQSLILMGIFVAIIFLPILLFENPYLAIFTPVIIILLIIAVVVRLPFILARIKGKTHSIIRNDQEGNPYLLCPNCKSKTPVNFGEIGDPAYKCPNCGATDAWSSDCTPLKNQLEQQYQEQQYRKLRQNCHHCKKEFDVEQLRNPPPLLTLISFPFTLLMTFIVGQKISHKYCNTYRRNINAALFFVAFIIAM